MLLKLIENIAGYIRIIKSKKLKYNYKSTCEPILVRSDTYIRTRY